MLVEPSGGQAYAKSSPQQAGQWTTRPAGLEVLSGCHSLSYLWGLLGMRMRWQVAGRSGVLFYLGQAFRELGSRRVHLANSLLMGPKDM